MTIFVSTQPYSLCITGVPPVLKKEVQWSRTPEQLCLHEYVDRVVFRKPMRTSPCCSYQYLKPGNRAYMSRVLFLKLMGTFPCCLYQDLNLWPGVQGNHVAMHFQSQRRLGGSDPHISSHVSIVYRDTASCCGGNDSSVVEIS